MKVGVNKWFYSIMLLLSMMYISCTSEVKKDLSSVNVNLSADPVTLHPYYHISIPSIHIVKHLFQPLVDFDYDKGGVVPVLVDSLAKVKDNEDGTTSYFYSLKRGAQWTNGDYVSVDDIIFSFKLVLNPIVSNADLNTSFDALIEVNKIEGEPSSFELVFESDFQNVEVVLTNLLIIPNSVYDGSRLMERISFEDLKKGEVSDQTKLLLSKFSKLFKNPVYHEDPKFIIGSGPYEVKSWEHDKELILSKKEKWYGDKVEDNMFFQNDVDQIRYVINEDADESVSQLLLGEIDVLSGIDFKSLKQLKQSKFFNDNFEIHSPTRYSYTFLGMHLKNPVLSSLKVRQAIAHAINKQGMVDEILGGYGDPTVGPLLRSELKSNSIEFDLEKAKALLQEDGWVDDNFDGFLEREVEGERQQLVFHLSYVKNKTARQMGEFLQNSLRQIGIRLILMELDFNTFLDLNKRHKFDLCLSNFQTYPTKIDPKNIWHSESYEYGTNWMGFGNEKTDALVQSIRAEKDSDKLLELQTELESAIQADLPCVFLFAPKHKIVVNKHIKQTKFSSFGLGFWESNYTKD